jgi:hypothetical protein
MGDGSFDAYLYMAKFSNELRIAVIMTIASGSVIRGAARQYMSGIIRLGMV